MSKPTTPPKKSVVITFRITEAQHQGLLEKCRNSTGQLTIKPSDLARASTLGATTIQPKDPELERYRIATAARIGNNLNQIAHQVNSANLKGRVNDQLFEDVIAELQHLQCEFAALLAPLDA